MLRRKLGIRVRVIWEGMLFLRECSGENFLTSQHLPEMCRSEPCAGLGKEGSSQREQAGPKVLRQEHVGIFQEKQRNHFTEIGEAEEEANLWGRKKFSFGCYNS